MVDIKCIEIFMSESKGSCEYGYGSGDGCGSRDGGGDRYGSGYGNGYGCGRGDGNGRGSGYGNGYGSGDGSGDGCGSRDGGGDRYGGGDGSGDGSGLSSFNGDTVVYIDTIPTVLTHIKGRFAKGFILLEDLSISPCYVVKQNNLFAHGKTLKEAQLGIELKVALTKPIEERISEFKEVFTDYSKKYPAIEFYRWHTILTGSCIPGKETFCSNNNINIDTAYFTVKEFINLTKEAYKGSIIKTLEERL